MGRLSKAARWVSAPEAEIARRVSRRATRWVMDRVRPEPKHESLGVTALKGLGAAAVALPVGYWLGRRTRRSSGGSV